MGYMVELNTLLGLPHNFNTALLGLGTKYWITKDRERSFPLHIAVLVVDKDWNFYGYGVVHSAIVKEYKTEFEFEMLSLFTEDVSAIYKTNFVSAATITGEVK